MIRRIALAAVIAAAGSAPAFAETPHAAAPAHAAVRVASPAAHPPVAATTNPRASAVNALAALIRGNDRFTAGKPVHPHQGAALRHELAGGQHPNVIVLSCADSRVPPELVFDQGFGDLFVVRAAGQVLDHATVASVEYAIEHLDVPLIVVLGHQACGAVKAALTVAPAAAGSDDLNFLVDAIRPGVAHAPQASDRLLDGAVRANVDAVVEGLLKRSAIVREHTQGGRLTVIPAIYLLKSGAVQMWDAAPLAAQH